MTASTGESRLTLAWEYLGQAPPVGLCVVREPGRLLVWDQAGQLALLGTEGQLLAQTAGDLAITAAAASADGRTVAALAHGAWVHLDESLATLAALEIAEPLAVALDSAGWYTAVSTASGEVLVLDIAGQVVTRFRLARPACFLALLDERSWTVAADDMGTVVVFDQRGRELWRERGHGRCGGLAVNGSGSRIALAGFLEGVVIHPLAGWPASVIRVPGTAARLAVDETGQVLVASTVERQVHGFRLSDGSPAVGAIAWSQEFAEDIVQIALAPLADRLWIAEATGRIACFELLAAR